MADTIRLRSPSGEVRAVDPAEFDVPSMLKNGFTRHAEPTREELRAAGKLMVPAHTRNLPKKRQEPFLVEHLPDIGGAVGEVGGRVLGGAAGVAAGLGVGSVPAAVVGQQAGGVAGAGLGGSTGESIRQLIDSAMGIPLPEDAPGAIRDAGLTQGAYTAAGGLLGKAARVGGAKAMEAAIRWTPEAAQTAIREGVTFGTKGLARIKGRLEEYGGHLRQILAKSASLGNKLPVDHVALEVDARLAKQLAFDKAGMPAESMAPAAEAMQARWDQLTDRFLNPKSGARGLRSMSPFEIQKNKTEFAALAKPIFEAVRRGEVVPPLELADAHWYKNASDVLREFLEKTTGPAKIGGRDVGIEELNKRSQDLILLKEVMTPAKVAARGSVGRRLLERGAAPTLGAAAGLALSPDHHDPKAAVLGGLLGSAATSPAALSRAALMLSSPAAREITRHAPRVVGAAMSERR